MVVVVKVTEEAEEAAAEAEAAEPVAAVGHLPAAVRGEQVEVVDVRREGDAAVAEFGEDGEGVGEPVVGEPVGVVPEEHDRPPTLRLRPVRLPGRGRGVRSRSPRGGS